jgi:hypothetical protein
MEMTRRELWTSYPKSSPGKDRAARGGDRRGGRYTAITSQTVRFLSLAGDRVTALDFREAFDQYSRALELMSPHDIDRPQLLEAAWAAPRNLIAQARVTCLGPALSGTRRWRSAACVRSLGCRQTCSTNAATAIPPNWARSRETARLAASGATAW